MCFVSGVGLYVCFLVLWGVCYVCEKLGCDGCGFVWGLGLGGCLVFGRCGGVFEWWGGDGFFRVGMFGFVVGVLMWGFIVMVCVVVVCLVVWICRGRIVMMGCDLCVVWLGLWVLIIFVGECWGCRLGGCCWFLGCLYCCVCCWCFGLGLGCCGVCVVWVIFGGDWVVFVGVLVLLGGVGCGVWVGWVGGLGWLFWCWLWVVGWGWVCCFLGCGGVWWVWFGGGWFCWGGWCCGVGVGVGVVGGVWWLWWVVCLLVGVYGGSGLGWGGVCGVGVGLGMSLS